MVNITPQPAPAKGTGASLTAWLLIGLALAAIVALAVVNATGFHPALTATRSASSPVVTGDGASGAHAASADVVEINVTVNGLRFVPPSVDVPAGKALRVHFTNTGEMVHDLKIGKAESGRLKPGQSAVVETEPFQEHVEGYCTIAGHRQQGMVFQVNVVAPDTRAGSTPQQPVAAPGGGQLREAPLVQVPSVAERTAARAGFVAFDPQLAPAEGTEHTERWEITEVKREVAPGVEQVQWLINGQAPAPLLRGKVGDKFRITVANKGTKGQAIDFHAGDISPDEAMQTILPGQEHTYEFTAHRAGMWMYHSSAAPQNLHIANGMAGAVIIDPPGNQTLRTVSAEYAFVATEVFLGKPTVGADPHRVNTGDYDLTAFNYYPNQYDLAPLHAKVGDTLRLWVLNAGPDQPLSFHVAGAQFTTVYKEGAYLLREATDSGAQALSLLPGEGGFVELTFTAPGTYSFGNHLLSNAEKGQHGQIVVSPGN